MEGRISIPDAVKQLLTIIDRLYEAYPHKSFTLDGRLLGDIGKILAEEAYELKLFDKVEPHHDAIDSKGRLVQIKVTMEQMRRSSVRPRRPTLTFPADHIPDYYLALHLHHDGGFCEVFNGPGSIAGQLVTGKPPSKNNLYNIGLRNLRALQFLVPLADRVVLRSRSQVQPSPHDV